MPIDAAEFDARRDLATIISQFLCKNGDKGFTVCEIAQATGFSESDVNNAMLKLAFSDLTQIISGKKKHSRVVDVTVGGTVYYRCISD